LGRRLENLTGRAGHSGRTEDRSSYGAKFEAQRGLAHKMTRKRESIAISGDPEESVLRAALCAERVQGLGSSTTSAALAGHAAQRSGYFTRVASRLRSPVRPNPSLNRTRYGRRRKPGPRHMVHHLVPGLRRLPPRAG
jgi:hypothetical protein